MSNDPDDRGPSGPTPLDYQTPIAGPGSGAARFLGGCALAVIVVAFGGLLLFFAVYSNFLSPQPQPRSWPSVIAFGLICAAATVAAIREIRFQQRPRWRWLLIGLLTGTAITALIEGLCFAGT